MGHPNPPRTYPKPIKLNPLFTQSFLGWVITQPVYIGVGGNPTRWVFLPSLKKSSKTENNKKLLNSLTINFEIYQ